MKVFFLPVLIFLAMSCSPVHEESSDERPNIILILVDDMGFSDLGCYGSEISTPTLDKLATEGIRFNQFHNTSKCFPSRACLLTGLYGQQVGNDRRPDTLRNSVTLAEVLKGAGYRTLMVGKHHGKENMYYRGFDRYYGMRDGASNHFNPGKQRQGEPQPAQKVKYGYRTYCIDSLTISPYTPPSDFYTTDYYTKYAVSYLEEYQSEEKPFFLYMSYTAPHDPLQAWPEDIAKYKGKYDQGYDIIRKARYQKQLDLGLIDSGRFPLSSPTYTPWDSLSAEARAEEARKMEVYAAMIDRVDQGIGRVLQKLKEINKYENTVIFFCSDNGASAEVVGMRSLNPGAKDGGIENIGKMEYWASLGANWANVSNTPFRMYKNYTHEGGINTPLIAWWPGKIKAGTFSDFTGHFIDFMPTVVDLAAATYPGVSGDDSVPAMQGRSLVPALTGKVTQRDREIYWKWAQGKGIWHNGYKLVSDNLEPWELYNLKEDATETINLVSQEQELADSLARQWNRWDSSMMQYKREVLQMSP